MLCIEGISNNIDWGIALEIEYHMCLVHKAPVAKHINPERHLPSTEVGTNLVL